MVDCECKGCSFLDARTLISERRIICARRFMTEHFTPACPASSEKECMEPMDKISRRTIIKRAACVVLVLLLGALEMVSEIRL